MMMLGDASGDQPSILQALALEREDEPNQTYFERNELDDVEAYDEDLHSDAEFNSTPTESVSVGLGKGDMENRIKMLCRPYGSQEPVMSPEELSVLDALADQFEMDRLKDLGVLQPVSTLEGLDDKRLTTRFVRTWRDKQVSNERCWLRRSRYVAREFSWLSPDRQDLFSPSSITKRLFAIVLCASRFVEDWSGGGSFKTLEMHS